MPHVASMHTAPIPAAETCTGQPQLLDVKVSARSTKRLLHSCTCADVSNSQSYLRACIVDCSQAVFCYSFYLGKSLKVSTAQVPCCFSCIYNTGMEHTHAVIACIGDSAWGMQTDLAPLS